MHKFVIQLDPLTKEKYIEVPFRKHHITEHPVYNKGSAFTEEEREALDLWGLLPEHVSTIEEQCQRVLESYSRKNAPLERYLYLLGLLDRNETLFYRVLLENLEEMLPYVYTPTVGEASKTFSHIFRRLRGLFVSANRISLIDRILSNAPFSNIHLIVVTDGERILGLGDQGVGGMTISIGKISLYVAGGGIHPALCLPVCIDVGTNNENLQKDSLYIGLKHRRLEGEEYDFVIEEFVKGVRRNFPHAILQWEDFGKQNALRLLNRYKDRICSFNDDIQGTGAIALSTVYSAMRAKNEKLKDQRYVIFGFGQAGYGIANALVKGMMEEGLTEKESKERIFPVDKDGLILEGMKTDEYQKPFEKDRETVVGWKFEKEGFIGLKDTVVNSKATVLIGTSGVGGSFDEEILKALAKNCEVPLILALSNPTSKSECTPEMAFKATNGKCLIATGSPFLPVKVNGEERFISQCNNMYIFPGIGLGAIVAMTPKITDEMFIHSAKQVAEMVTPEELRKGKLLPDIKNIRKVSEMVAFIVAKTARDLEVGVRGSDERLLEMVRNSMWNPEYLPYRWAGEE